MASKENAIDDARESAAADPGRSAATSGESPDPRVFHVNFTNPSRPGFSTNKPTNDFRWIGSGDVTIKGGGLRIIARRSRPFWFATDDDQTFPLASVINVEAFDNIVTLSIAQPNAKARPIKFWAADAADATAIANRLPKAATEGFAPAMAEAAAFSKHLLEVTPKTTVTFGLVAVNCLAFLAAAALGGGVLVPNAEVMVRLGSDYTPLTMGGEWWRLITSTFLHFGIVHLALNMWALYTNGPIAERIFGNVRFLAIYLFAGLTGSLTSLLWHPVVNGAGASGAIFGVFGALLAFFVRKPSGMPLSVLRAQRTSVLVFVAYNIINGARFQGIDNAAHLGGLAGGFALGLLLCRPMEPERRSENTVRDWVSAAAIIVATGIGLPYLLHAGVLHPRSATTSSPSPTPTPVTNGTETTTPVIQSLWGVSIGASPGDVMRQHGAPMRKTGAAWSYNSVDPRHDGVVEVDFNPAPEAPTARVVLVRYFGDRASAPPELPNLAGSTGAELRARFGMPYSTATPVNGPEIQWFRNGVVAAFEHGHVLAYGIFDLEAARKSQQPRDGR